MILSAKISNGRLEHSPGPDAPQEYVPCTIRSRLRVASRPSLRTSEAVHRCQDAVLDDGSKRVGVGLAVKPSVRISLDLARIAEPKMNLANRVARSKVATIRVRMKPTAAITRGITGTSEAFVRSDYPLPAHQPTDLPAYLFEYRGREGRRKQRQRHCAMAATSTRDPSRTFGLTFTDAPVQRRFGKSVRVKRRRKRRLLREFGLWKICGASEDWSGSNRERALDRLRLAFDHPEISAYSPVRLRSSLLPITDTRCRGCSAWQTRLASSREESASPDVHPRRNMIL
jgi:hypothetical protein